MSAKYIKINLVYCLLHLIAIQPLSALDLSVSIGRFQSTENSYIEFNVFVLGPTLGYHEATDTRSIELLILIEDGEHTLHADRLNVIGPGNGENFNITRRYAITQGEYHFEIRATDNTDTTNTFFWEDDIIIKPKSPLPALSDILLLSHIEKSNDASKASKHGYILKHLPFNYSKADITQVYYYVESYLPHADPDSIYLVQIQVEEAYKNRHNQVVFNKRKKRHQRPLDIIIGKLNTSSYASGNYRLIISLLDHQNKILSSTSTYFQHSQVPSKNHNAQAETPDTVDFFNHLTTDQLHYSLRAVLPRLPSIHMEAVNTALKLRDRTKLLHELRYHWHQLAPDHTQTAYENYMKVAKAVDKKFQSGFGAGFETDRGYYYLKYGKPSTVTGDKTDPVAPPYEIWTYDQIPELQQTHVKFIFYNPSLAPEDYRLLHSTAKGEVNNPRWQVILYKNAPNDLNGNNHIDNPTIKDGYRRNAVRYFDDN